MSKTSSDDPGQLRLFSEVPPTEKVCTRCGEAKPPEAFYVDRQKRCGRQSRCIECVKAYKASPEYHESVRQYKEKLLATPVEATAKPCKKCGESKPLDAFYVDRFRKDGRRATCIDCDKARKRTDEVHAQSRKYYHGEKGKTAERRYIESGKKTQSVDKELRAERMRRYHANGIEKEWRTRYERSEKGRKRLAKYRSRPEFREKMRIYRELPLTFTEQDWLAALEYFGHCCAYCGSDGPLQREHFIPISRGGTNLRNNIVPSCVSCNPSKHDKLPEDWCHPEVYKVIMLYFRSLEDI